MQDKTTLINSMNNLINHITINNKNQQQMFHSLTRKDFDKIMNNLEDPLQKLRMTTVHLLSQLLYKNENLKNKFCIMMNIHYTTNSNIILNNNIYKILDKYPNKVLQIYTILKTLNKISNINKQNNRKQILFWYINPQNIKLTIQYIYKQDILKLINNNNRDIGNKYIFDPIYCIFGLNLKDNRQNNIQRKISAKQIIQNQLEKQRVSIKSSELTTRSRQNSNYQPKNIINIGYNNNIPSRPSQQYVINSARNSVNNNMNMNMYNNNKYPQKPRYIQNRTSDYLQLNNSMTLQAYVDNKKQNQIFNADERDKYNNRLSLQGNYYKNSIAGGHGTRKNTSQLQSKQIQNKNIHEHHHGIKLMTPRQSVKGSQKISLTGYNNGSNTQRYNADKSISFPDSAQRNKIKQKMNQSTQAITNTQKLRTIHLGKGSKGWQTTRDNKNNIRIQN